MRAVIHRFLLAWVPAAALAASAPAPAPAAAPVLKAGVLSPASRTADLTCADAIGTR